MDWICTSNHLVALSHTRPVETLIADACIILVMKIKTPYIYTLVALQGTWLFDIPDQHSLDVLVNSEGGLRWGLCANVLIVE